MNLALTFAGRALVRAGLPVAAFERRLERSMLVRARLDDGTPLRLLGGDRVANRVFWRGWSGHEPEASPIWLDLARRSAVVMDVGAFNGYYAVLAALGNPRARVVACEPFAVARARLQRNLDLNRLSTVEVCSAAIGRAAGRAPFWHRTDGLPTSSGLEVAFVYAKGGDIVAEEVDVTTVDALVDERELGGLDLLKVDTETTEHDVLAGGARAIERHRPAILCEVLEAGRPAEIEAIVRPLGYRTYLLTGGGPLEREVVRPDPAWRNWLLAPPERWQPPPGAGSR